MRPNGPDQLSNASILSCVPVTSTMSERLVTSTTLPRKISTDLEDLGAGRPVGRDLEERQLARDGVAGLEVADLQDVDELVQLLGDLVDRVQRAVERQRDARDARRRRSGRRRACRC